MACTCIRCEACGGSGLIWVDYRGSRVAGVYKHRTDDLDEPENCPSCRGSGDSETCDECAYAGSDPIYDQF